MTATARPTLDRVGERRRAAALARHYRETERLPIAVIARRLGRAVTTVRAAPALSGFVMTRSSLRRVGSAAVRMVFKPKREDDLDLLSGEG